MRKEIEREQPSDGRVSQKGCIDVPFGHKIDQASPCDTDPMHGFTVPDCAYKGFDSYTWPEGRASDEELPCCTKEVI
jgi:hypothetical protein